MFTDFLDFGSPLLRLCCSNYDRDSFAQTDAASALGASIGFAIVAPHLIVTFLAAVFTMLAWAMNKRGFALTGGILFAVAMALFPLYFMFVIVQLILAFVGFARLKQINT